MATIVSQAGDIKLDIQSLAPQGNELVLEAVMGVWDSSVHISPEEVARIWVSGLTNPSLVFYMLRLPIILLRRSLSRRWHGAP
ncbi:MAG: hypothetical protein Q7R39_06095 [Dehalococcoidia bacterium]|nr:hypothetical protein [Dehalococcoidia bacterium]